MNSAIPLVYSCSGCSNVAQLTNRLALYLDRQGLAEMSCIAGVGGHVPALVNLAKSGRKKIVIDGCPMACSKSCLTQHDLEPDLYVKLYEYGFKKRRRLDYNEEELIRAKKIILELMQHH